VKKQTQLRSEKTQKSKGSLKKTAAICSAEAAAVSLVVHLLILGFAGSIVAYQYINRDDVVFEGQNIERPKMKRKQLKIPIKVQNLQKKTRRPRVSTRMTSASKSALALPDLSGLGNGLGSDVGTSNDGGEGRDMSSLGATKGFDFSLYNVNFFGARSRGEKLVFVVSADEEMMADDKGGYFTYQYVKDRVLELVGGMRGGTLFNVMFYAGSKMIQFSPTLLPATEANKQAVAEWIKPFNSSPHNLEAFRENYQGGEVKYETPYNPTSWVRPTQSAFEQKADNVFILLPRYGPQLTGISRKKDDASWLRECGWEEERIQKVLDRQEEREMAARELLEKENEARERKGLPPRIVGRLRTYMDEKKSQLPPKIHIPPQCLKYTYTEEEVLEHLNEVYEANYIPDRLKKPKIHMVQLIASDGRVENTESVKKLRNVTKTFRGRFSSFRGAKTMKDLIGLNDLNDE